MPAIYASRYIDFTKDTALTSAFSEQSKASYRLGRFRILGHAPTLAGPLRLMSTSSSEEK